MHKKNHFLLIVFIFLSLFSIAKLYDNSANLDSWQYGEWLINYQNGFVRRGLIGELIYLMSTLFNENIQVAFFIIISIICILFYFLNYYFIKDIKLNFIYWLIIFSPLFYLFFVVVSKVGINREIIFYIYYLLYLIHLIYFSRLSRNILVFDWLRKMNKGIGSIPATNPPLFNLFHLFHFLIHFIPFI